MREITVAIAGNPNSGKTTIFNALTGSRQHVGNYAGVTVEKKEGTAERNGVRFKLIDLPGTYSLSANSPEEVVARDYLVKEKPDVVVHVVDASNLDRNLYLTTQLMELGLRLVVALNMVDIAEKRGISFDLDALSRHLKAPVTPTVGNRARGVDGILAAAAGIMDAPPPVYAAIPPPDGFAALADDIDAALSGPDRALADEYPPKWLAARLLENDPDIAGRIADHALLVKIGEFRADFEKRHHSPPEIRATEAKFGWTAGLTAEVVRRGEKARSELSDKVDAILLNRYLGLPIFLGLMYLMFQLVFTLAEKPMEWIERLFAAVGTSAAHLWPRAADSPLRDLLVDGVIGGVGGVLVFLPNILLLFLAIAFLEGTGYMARAAFIMDAYMHRIGLHGKSFIPMLLGFGCNVPAIMGTRTLENRRDRFTTIMVIPFMSCGARLPIYTLIIPAFFPDALHAWMLWLVYVIGILFAVFGAKLLRSTVFKGDAESFVIELPPYRMPTLRTVLLLMWDRGGEYCKKAGTIVLTVSIILWAMTVYPKKEAMERDYAAERVAARAAFDAGAAAIGAAAGLGEGGRLLADWTNAREALLTAEGEYWDDEQGYKDAVTQFAFDATALYSRPGGEALKSFTETVDAIAVIRAEYEEAVGEDADEGSLAQRNAAIARDAAMADLPADPAVVKAALAYREEVDAAYRGTLSEIDNAEAAERLAYSASGRVGSFLEPVLRPLGFDWRIGTAIIGSFAAKEVFVAQMGIVYSVGAADEESASLRDKLRQHYAPLQAFCMMIYCLLSMPCVVTIAVTRRETGGWTYAVAMMVGLTFVAYVTTFIIFQAGTLLGIGV